LRGGAVKNGHLAVAGNDTIDDQSGFLRVHE
jgi:hypothetical protein